MDHKNQEFSPSELAKFCGVLRGAIYFAIRTGRLKARFDGYRHWISMQNYLDYAKGKYKRTFPEEVQEGDMTIPQLAKAAKVSVQMLYYHIRKGSLNAKKVKSQYIIEPEECEKLKEYLKKIRWSSKISNGRV